MYLIRKQFRKAIILAVTITTIFISSCDKDDDKPTTPTEVINYGDSVKVGNGIAQPYIKSGKSGNPESVGFILSEAALDGLPEHDTVYTMHFPANNKTLTDHISLNYSAHGHEPPGIYDVPHFDVHFYSVTEQEQNAITENDPKSEILPPTEYWPKNYIPGSAEPKMGKHWVDSLTPELHGQPFTQTLIYGSYNGKFTFLEPMIAISYLKTKPTVNADVTPLGKTQDAGYYPDSYTILWEKERKVYGISLDELTYQTK